MTSRTPLYTCCRSLTGVPSCSTTAALASAPLVALATPATKPSGVRLNLNIYRNVRSRCVASVVQLVAAMAVGRLTDMAELPL